MHPRNSGVSIPFKREGLSEHADFTDANDVEVTITFQFPSNGKDFPNKLYLPLRVAFTNKFQFPSNGKGLSELKLFMPQPTIQKVSIPFKREGLSERWTLMAILISVTRVSIPFKREGLSELLGYHEDEIKLRLKFQFPSNGKDFPNL